MPMIPMSSTPSSTMPTSTATTTSPLSSSYPTSLSDDAYIASLEEKLLRFEKQRTSLQSELLTLKARHTLSSTLNPAPLDTSDEDDSPPSSLASTIPDAPPGASDDDILTFALSRSSTLDNHMQTRLHRMSGVTSFTIQEPGRGGEKMLGVRIESFSQAKRLFEKPVYMMFRLDRGESWILSRHTIPAFVGAGKLAEIYLPIPSKGVPRPEQKLDELVKHVRSRVLKWRHREEIALAVKDIGLNAGTVGDVTERWIMRVDKVWWDTEVSKFLIRWGNSTSAEMAIDVKGTITKVVFKNRNGDRKRDMERDLLGPLDALPEKFGWIS